MKIKPKLPVIFACLALVIAVPVIFFFIRSPVLIVTDLAFIPLYGQSRIRAQTRASSFALFRRVIPITVSDDAGYEIVQFAIAEVSSRPFCVLFPFRFARAAMLYHENHPEIPVVLLESRELGRNLWDSYLPAIDNEVNFFVYRTDIESDFYRAGHAAAVFNSESNGKIAVFLESNVYTQAREAFLRAFDNPGNGADEDESLPVPDIEFFSSFSQYYEIPDLTCVVLAGTGAEYLENYSSVPVIFFTWIDPEMLPDDVIMIVNDSPWVQAVPAVRMTAAGIQNAQIQSKFQVINSRNIDKQTLRKIQKHE